MNEMNERTFTQTELNNIVSDRLKAERAKITKEIADREADLTRRESLLSAKADWTRRGLPADLLDSLDLSREGAIEAAETALQSYQARTSAQRGGFPGKPDMIGDNSRIDDARLRNAFGLKH